MPNNSSKSPHGQFCRRTRREFLWESGAGFGSLGLTALLSGDGFLSRQAVAADGQTRFVNPMAPRQPQFTPKAKSVIFLFMYGGPSHVDTFDYKPKLYPLDGKTIEVKTFGRGGHRNQGRVVGPKWNFHQYGQCGKWVSDLFPNLAHRVDDIAFIHSMYAESPIHGSAMLMMNSGRILSGHPALGSWVTYGLGSENENFPGFVVMLDKTGGPISGPKNWSSGYMPAAYQGVVIRADGTPIHNLDLPPGMTREAQRELLDHLREKNEEHLLLRTDNSDAHADLMKNHTKHAGDTDKPIAGLLADLRRLGLLDSTIVVWGGEFGRQPTAEYAQGTGRDHNAYGFTMWLAGGGITGGVSVGKTDELGNFAVEDRFHVKNLHATVLHQMGLDPNKLSYFHGGLDQKLVGVEGAEPIKQII